VDNNSQSKDMEVVSAMKGLIDKILHDDTLTKSAKMRQLLRLGVSRAQVAKIMDVSYQFVYQVDIKRLADEETVATLEAQPK